MTKTQQKKIAAQMVLALNLPPMRKLLRVQIAAAVFPSTPESYATEQIFRRTRDALRIADEIIRQAGL
jgi:hypothetical protein